MQNVIIVGLGEVGSYLTRVFTDQGFNITIVDNNPETLAKVEENNDVQSFMGNITQLSTLQTLEVHKADLFLAVTSNDDVNLLSAMMAKQLGAKLTVSRVSHQDFMDNPTGFYHEFMGIDLIINPELLAAKQAETFIRTSSAYSVSTFLDNLVELYTFSLGLDHPVLDKLVKDIKLPEEVILSGIIRQNEFIRPTGTDLFLEDDKVIVFSKPEFFPEIDDVFGSQGKTDKLKISILGAGDIGEYLAKNEERYYRHSIRLIDKDRVKATRISESLSRISVVSGDATRIEFLNEENIGDDDIFIATTRNDEVNLLSCLMAKELGVKKTVSIVHKPDYAPIFEKLGINLPISPRLFAAKEIAKFIRTGEVSNAVKVENGVVEVLEILTIKDSKITRSKLGDIPLPRGATIIALKEGDKIIFPTDETQVKPNSYVLILTIPQNRRSIENMIRKKGFGLS